MQLKPLYVAERLHPPAYHLRYTWTGWPSSGSFPPTPDTNFFQQLGTLWESDGIRLLEYTWRPDAQSPEEIALGFLNNTACAFGQQAIWRPGYDAGSFGEYDMDAVRD